MLRLFRRHLVDIGIINHCVWRSHNFSLVLDSAEACEKFKSLLARYKDQFGVRIHSYCLMGTHLHVVCTATLGQPAFSSFWKLVNQCFAQWHNRRAKARGQVVMQRMRSPQIRDERHMLTVM